MLINLGTAGKERMKVYWKGEENEIERKVVG